ncbi:MAG TPA: hypothetical protein VNE58_17780 [Casimicrobiaceae bacterium]|nr:hypothetical protein [Casimicrobiaceae bacterium]
MRSHALISSSILAVALGSAGMAQALTCYVVLDRTDNVIYRDVYPPVDLSDAGRAERDDLRRRGEFLLFLESESCPRLEFFTGAAGTVGLRLDQTLSPPTDMKVEPARAQEPAKAPPARTRKPRA